MYKGVFRLRFVPETAQVSCRVDECKALPRCRRCTALVPGAAP